MKKQLVLSAFILSLVATPAFTTASDCSSKTLNTITTSYSSSYEGKVNTPKRAMNTTKEMKIKRLKTLLSKTSIEHLEMFHDVLVTYENKIATTNPNYQLITDLKMFVEGLLDEKEMMSIAQIVVATDGVSILKDVVVALDLVDTLAGEGNFTVFAPTNAAFEKLLVDLDMSFDELAANTELLKTVVLYHVLGSEVMANDVLGLTEGTLVETLQGESLRVSNWDGVQVDMSNVITTDIDASNGVIHLIDEVMLPPSVRESLGMMTDRGDENIVTTAVNAGTFPTLIAAVQAAGLVETLSGDGPFTVYAPTEEAFADLLSTLNITAEELLADTELLTSVLTYHVVPGFYTSEDILSLDSPMESQTAAGVSVMIEVNNGVPMINESKIIATDVYATNGVIHVIDKVLIPAS